jgi:protocatechuate 3,4-dioxygenase beta subunit
MMSAPAQQLTGSVAGQVKDSEGTAIPGVAVTLGRGAWTAMRSTDNKGNYQFETMPPGSYTAWHRRPAACALRASASLAGARLINSERRREACATEAASSCRCRPSAASAVSGG